MKQALFFKKKKNQIVECELCPHHCIINPKRYGSCNARINLKGVLYSEVYGKISALNIDPIEKKPLYHFFPGTKAYSIGTCGCNFHCTFCQNYEISQTKTKDYQFIKNMTPKQVVEQAQRTNCKSIAYTYNEPTVNYEFVLETAKLASKNKLNNVFITNGYIEKKPLKQIAKYLDAANIDLKSFSKKFYKEQVFADLDKVLESIKLYHKLKIYIELTTLVIPKYNDNSKELKQLCKWIFNNLGPNVPLHFSRFFPHYKLKGAITPEQTITKAIQIAKKAGINYVYGGNIWKEKFVNTYCPKCNALLIDRFKSMPEIVGVKGGKCQKCKEKILLFS